MTIQQQKHRQNAGEAGQSRRDALYARYSSHAQDDSTSITVQIEACERAAGGSLVHFIDQAKTGRTTGGRVELLRLIAEASAGRIGRLYVYKFDRLGRAAETHVLVEDLEACGVEVISVTEGTNALARGVQLVVAADYSRVLAQRTREGLAQRHKEGCWTGGPPPYGYRSVPMDAASGSNRKRLAVHDEEAETVRFVFDSYLAESIGLKEVARRLRDRGIPTRQGGPWGFGTVRSILLNTMVVGDVRYMRRCFKLNKGTGRRVPRFNDEGRHLVKHDESLRIIDDETFRRAQEQLAVNSVSRPRALKELRPFTRHLFCAECGGVCYSRKSENSKGSYRYYSCGRRYAIGNESCSNSASVREDKLWQRVQGAMAAVFEDMDGVLEDVAAASREALESSRFETSRIKREIGELDDTMAGLIRVLVDADIEPTTKRSISRQVAECEVRREGLRQALEAVTVQAADDMDSLMSACHQAFLEARADFASLMNPAQTNRFIAEVVGPMLVLPDGSVVQKQQNPTAEAMGSMKVAGDRYARCTHGAVVRRDVLTLAIRAVFWSQFNLAA